MTDFFWAVVPYLIPLGLISIYGIGLILHKAQALKHAGALDTQEFSTLLEAVAGRREVTGLSPSHPLGFLLAHAHEGPHLLQARAQALLAGLEDRISYFPALANVATLTGLFGTVMGMIGAFLALRSGGGADPSSLAGGLGTALTATALGLVTAIPSLTAHAVFQKKVQATAAQMEALLSALLPGPGERGA
jgi:biopolymer transport protein ExbB